jgi:probable phosphoglycerate mutase
MPGFPTALGYDAQVELILVRHAQPVWVEDGRSVLNPKLSELGLEQARRLAEEARSWSRPSELWVSPTRRSRETAAPLAETFGLEPTIHPWLEELKLPAEWEGKDAITVGAAIRGGRQRPEEEWWSGPPGGESFRAFWARVTEGLSKELVLRGLECDRTEALHLFHGEKRDHRVLVVAHTGTNAVLVSRLLGLAPVPWVWERFGAQHASVTRLKAQALLGASIFSLRVFSDVSHLPRELRTR